MGTGVVYLQVNIGAGLFTRSERGCLPGGKQWGCVFTCMTSLFTYRTSAQSRIQPALRHFLNPNFHMQRITCHTTGVCDHQTRSDYTQSNSPRSLTGSNSRVEQVVQTNLTKHYKPPSPTRSKPPSGGK